MKNFFFCLLATMTLMTIGCSDPCDNVDCGVGTCVDGTCDCPDGFSGVNCEIEDLCFNADCGNGTCDDATGSCVCDAGYEGDNCESEIRARFIGTWNSTNFSCDGEPEDNLTLIIVAGDEIFDVKVTDPTEPDLEVISTVSEAGDSFVIEPQLIVVDGGATEVTISGNGTLQDGVMSLFIIQSVVGFGDIACSGSFVQ